MRRITIATCAAAAAAALTSGTISTVSAAPPERSERVIVMFTDGVPAAAGAEAIRAAGGKVDRLVTNVFSGAIAQVPAASISGLQRNPTVALVEMDGSVTFAATQTSPTWGLDRIDQAALPLNGTFGYPDSAGTGVNAYIVDTGVRADHVDLAGRVASGYTAIVDGLGTADCNGHGTHVAATAAGTTWGVAKKATVVPVKVLDCAGSGTWSGVISGLDWIAQHHTAGAAAVANMSLGGGALSSVDTAVQALVADGVTVVVAAGNSNVDACTTSPARTPAAVTVAATDRQDARASFSNWGSCVDLFAPGVSITSAGITDASSTATLSGTSMASPHVAGIAALYLGLNPTATPAAVTDALLAAATRGVVTNTASSPNLLAGVPTTAPPAVTVPATPEAPFASTLPRRTVQVTWKAPADGGSAISSYIVTAYNTTGAKSSYVASGSSTSLRVSLKSGSYFFTVTAVNSVGRSVESPRSNTVLNR